MTRLRQDGLSALALGVFATRAAGKGVGSELEPSVGRWGDKEEYARRVQNTTVKVTDLDRVNKVLEDLEPHAKFLKKNCYATLTQLGIYSQISRGAIPRFFDASLPRTTESE